MFFSPKNVERTDWVIAEFLEPVRLRIERHDQSRELVGYGIGERIEVLVEYGNLASIHNVRRTEIPMKDGSKIVDWEPEIPRLKYVKQERI